MRLQHQYGPALSLRGEAFQLSAKGRCMNLLPCPRLVVHINNIQLCGSLLSGSTVARTNGPGNSSFHTGRVTATRGLWKFGVSCEACAGCHPKEPSRATNLLQCARCKRPPGCRGLHRLQLQGARVKGMRAPMRQ